MGKVESKTYKCVVEVENELDPSYFITLPDELIEELGWNEETDLVSEIKMGPRGNVLVVSRKSD